MSPTTPVPTLIPKPVAGGDAGVRTIAELLTFPPDPTRCYALLPAYGPSAALQRLQSHLTLDPPIGDALCCPTSGSTGMPRMVVLQRASIALAAATRDDEMGGPSAWFVGIPPVTAGGLIAIARGLRSPMAPKAWSGAGVARFDPAQFAAEAAQFLDHARACGVAARVSLVATQVHRLLGDPQAAGILARFDSVLVGGGPMAEATRIAARAADIAVVHSYGATETCGGCVYDGQAVSGTQVRIDHGEVQISGDCLAYGYLDGPLRLTDDGWWRSGDRGSITDGNLRITGRFDDIVTINGTNVDLAAVRRVLTTVPGVREAAVVTTPDPAGGVRLHAFIVGEVAPDDIRAKVGAALGAAAVPRVSQIARLPLLVSGKVDLDQLREDI